MRAVIQRVTQSGVRVGGEPVARISAGLLVLLGVADGDSTPQADYLADKIVNLRVFEDQDGKMNRSLLDTGGEMLVVSQFTLLGDCRKGRRPSFVGAAQPEAANRLYEYFVERVRGCGVRAQTGRFGAMMQVDLVNDGPVTFMLESTSQT
ncbi:MAG: D-aminoacyl-tRNA deacylase [Candidatus Methylomirabilia bacterium]